MIAVLKKCIFFLLWTTGRWRGEEPRHAEAAYRSRRHRKQALQRRWTFNAFGRAASF